MQGAATSPPHQPSHLPPLWEAGRISGVWLHPPALLPRCGHMYLGAVRLALEHYTDVSRCLNPMLSLQSSFIIGEAVQGGRLASWAMRRTLAFGGLDARLYIHRRVSGQQPVHVVPPWHRRGKRLEATE